MKRKPQVTCPECGGEGKILLMGKPDYSSFQYQSNTDATTRVKADCPRCQGTGTIDKE